MPPQIYAIDFGTSNSLLAAADRDRVYDPIPLDPSAPNPTIFRSVLHFSDGGEWAFGADALRTFVAQGMRGRLMRSVKRFLPMKSFVETHLGTRKVKLEQIVGVFLREMRARANRHFGADVRRVLLGRPARFSEDAEEDRLAQSRLEGAARFAGFDEVSFCAEPEAAAHDFRAGMRQDCTVLVVDLGGGTSDYTIVRFHGEDPPDVVATFGVPVAGDAIDGSLMRHSVAKHFGAGVVYKVPFGANTLTMPRGLMDRLCAPAEICLLARRDVMAFLRDIRAWSLGADDERVMDQLLRLVEDSLGFQVFESIEATKVALSSSDRARFVFDYPGIDIDEAVTRAAFEAGAHAHVDRILGALDQTLELGGVSPAGIDRVCLTGGTAKLPKIAQRLAAQFGGEKLHSLSAFHSVIQGLAQRARAMEARRA
ncbi:MAG TPA: Hsp70 family protein [Polyangiaceae bacterium]|nr:Hsp70 family protein [Polyangiaceae bacterium]